MKKFFCLTIILVLFACSSNPPKPETRLIHLEPLPDWRLDLDLADDREASISEREYAVASWVYSVAADRAYLEPENLCFPFDEKWHQIFVGSEQYRELTKNGFFAQAWYRTNASGRKELIIVYRGTDGADDFLYGNFSFIRSPFSISQFESALTFRDLVFEQTRKDNLGFDHVIFVGHSLGGGLAQYVQDFTERSQAFVFNASPNRGRLYSLFRSHKSEKFVTRLYEKGEVLKWPRWLLFDFDPFNNSNPGGPGMNTRWFQFYEDHLIENHNMKDFSAALTKLAAAAGDPQAIAVMNHLRERRVTPNHSESQNCKLQQ